MKYCVTRDLDGDLKLHLVSEKFPKRSDWLKSWIGDHIYLDKELFPDLKWENDPVSVKLKIEVDEQYATDISSETIQTEQSSKISEIHDGMDN